MDGAALVSVDFCADVDVLRGADFDIAVGRRHCRCHASVGLTEEEAKAAGHDVRIGKSPFAALGRAMTLRETDGFVKFVTDKATGRILGVHVVGPAASDLISEAMLALEMGATAEDVALTMHPHPTLGEALMEASAASLGQAIHVVNR